ncbi:MAG: hypothetical protein WDZ40_02460 [Candidatus Spechtbacterales bacterium]
MELITEFAVEYRNWILFTHIAGSIIAIGAVTATDLLLLFFKLKPGLISVISRVAPILSIQVWLGLILISLSGFLLFIPLEGLEQYWLFKLKMLLVLGLFLNGIFLNVWVTPKFSELAPEWEQKTPRVKKFMVIAGISTTVSFVCWWSVVVIMKVFY